MTKPTQAQIEAVDKIISTCLDTNASNEDIRQATMEIFAAITAAAEVGSDPDAWWTSPKDRPVIDGITPEQDSIAMLDAAEVGETHLALAERIIIEKDIEIARLRRTSGEDAAAAEVGGATAKRHFDDGYQDGLRDSHDGAKVEAATVERCAQVADKWAETIEDRGMPPILRRLAAAIRALKDA